MAWTINRKLANTVYGMVRDLANEYDEARHFCDGEDYASLEAKIAECGHVSRELHTLFIEAK